MTRTKKKKAWLAAQRGNKLNEKQWRARDEVKVKVKVKYVRPYDHLADEAYNRHVVHWEAGELRANFESEDEDDGWISLTRADGRSMWYHPATRRAYWTGFEPRTEFFIRDIEQYIHQKFYA